MIKMFKGLAPKQPPQLHVSSPSVSSQAAALRNFGMLGSRQPVNRFLPDVAMQAQLHAGLLIEYYSTQEISEESAEILSHLHVCRELLDLYGDPVAFARRNIELHGETLGAAPSIKDIIDTVNHHCHANPQILQIHAAAQNATQPDANPDFTSAALGA